LRVETELTGRRGKFNWKGGFYTGPNSAYCTRKKNEFRLGNLSFFVEGKEKAERRGRSGFVFQMGIK